MTPLELSARECAERCADTWFLTAANSRRRYMAGVLTPIILDALRRHCEHEWPVISSIDASTTDPLALAMGADYGRCVKCGKERESL